MEGDKKRILITAAGGTDPYTLTEGTNDYNDGSILSIIRQKEYENEPITEAYVYLSLEMAIREARNKVFTKSIKSINPDIEVRIFPEGAVEEVKELVEQKEITEEVIENKRQKAIEKAKENNPNFNEEAIRRNLTDDKIIFNLIKSDVKIAIFNANKFGIFYSDFYEIIRRIKEKYGTSIPEIFINVSSGTPAMEMDLDLIAITNNEIKAKIVQVSTPMASSNVRGNRGYATASEEQLKALNEVEQSRRENSGYIKRVSYENMEKTRKLILLESLEDSFAKYDYAGAYNAVRENIGIIKEDSLIVKYVTNLYYRYIGDDKKARSEKIFLPDKDGNKITLGELYPIFDDNDNRLKEILKVRGLVERINVMKVKEQRQEINDWLLITQTIIESLYRRLIYVVCDSFNVDEIINQDKKSGKYGKIDIDLFNKINFNGKYEKIRIKVEKNDAEYVNAFFLRSILYSWLVGRNYNKKLKDTIVILDKIRNSRNLAAHTEEFITLETLNNSFLEAIELENEYRANNNIDILALTEEEKKNATVITNKLIINLLNKIMEQSIYKTKMDEALSIYNNLKDKVLDLLRKEIESE